MTDQEMIRPEVTGQVMTFYHFVSIDPVKEQERLQVVCESLGLIGTLLIAEEGINGTLAGSAEAVTNLTKVFSDDPQFCDMKIKVSPSLADKPVFYRLKVVIKDEIVAMGVTGVKPDRKTGDHVDVQTWNKLLDDPNVPVIDTRNHYEISIGTFPGSVNPETESFREFPEYIKKNYDPEKTPRIAMCCTGGVRCEKASAYLLDQGFEAVYQLEGGILKYFESASEEDNRWQGDCFVFDQRVSLDKNLRPGNFIQCHACRRALSADQVKHADYVKGVSCSLCIDEDKDRTGFIERQKQIELAAKRGEQHLGVGPKKASSRRS